VKENDTEELSNSIFINFITSSFLVISPKLFREELLGFSNLGLKCFIIIIIIIIIILHD